MSIPDEPRPRVLVGEPEKPPTPHSRPIDGSSRAWSGLVGLGVALAIVGWVDLALLWWPPQFGNPQWEFVIITNFLDALPVATLGVTIAAFGAMARSWRGPVIVTAVIAALLTAVLIALSIIYLLDLPLALRSTPPTMKSVMYRTMLKSGAFAATYVAFYGWLAWFAWRHRNISSS